MKRHKSTVLPVLLVLFLTGAAADAQSVSPSQNERRRVEVQDPAVLDLLRSLTQKGEGGRGLRGGGLNVTVQSSGAWWTNAALVTRLGLTDDQKAKIERAFENHRQNLVSSTGLLEKEEAQLARLLEAESIDRNAVLSQIDRVTQARSEMERVNAVMTLEMREYLTRAQWTQLQAETLQTSLRTVRYVVNGERGAPTPPPPSGPGQRRGGRGPQ